MSQQIQISEMEKVIMDALEEYAEKAADVIGETLPIIGQETAQDLRATSPKRTGEYAASWTYGMQTSRGSKKKNKLVVYNKKHYRIVHLLEHGHAKRNGGRSEGEGYGQVIHVKPAQERAEKKAIEQITDKLENLGV